MSNFFDKISTLVNAQVNDLLGKNPTSPLARIRLNPEEAEKNPHRSAQALRQRLDEAILYEDDLQAKIDHLSAEALDLDADVDACLQRDDQLGARRLQGQLNMKQQQLAIAESELRDHRRVTQHLMHEMLDLDAALEEFDRRPASKPPDSGSPGRSTRIPIEGAEAAASSVVDSVTDKLNEARDSLDSLLNREPEKPAPTRRGRERIVIVDEEPDPRTPKPPKQDPGDMSRRLSRLSKPAEDD